MKKRQCGHPIKEGNPPWHIYPTTIRTLPYSKRSAIIMGFTSPILHLWGMEQDGDTIPKPSAVDTLQMKQGDVLCLLDANMFSMRAEMNHRPVKKTLTIPWYLNELAEKHRLNFSQILQSALRDRLSV